MDIGARIKILDAGCGCYGANGHSGVVTSQFSDNGLLSTDPGYNVLLENGQVWRINPNARVEALTEKGLSKSPKVSPKPFKPSNIPIKSLDEIIKGCKLVRYVTYTDDYGAIEKIILEYVPEEA